MSERILTLFGEEFAPEQPKTPPKGRAKKKQDEEKPAEEITEAKEEAPAPKSEQPVPAPQVIPVAEEVPVPVVGIIPVVAEVAEPIKPVAPAPKEEQTIAPIEVEVVAIIEQAAHATVEPPEPEKAPEEQFLLPEDWKGDKNYYTIGEVAELFKVKTSHIRFWTNEFKLKVRTTRKGDRMYTPDQVRELKAIHHLVKERGFTLAGAKAKMKAQNNKDVETVDLKDSLKQLRTRLVIMRDQLG